jgi:hypothetical protein
MLGERIRLSDCRRVAALRIRGLAAKQTPSGRTPELRRRGDAGNRRTERDRCDGIGGVRAGVNRDRVVQARPGINDGEAKYIQQHHHCGNIERSYRIEDQNIVDGEAFRKQNLVSLHRGSRERSVFQ